MSDVFATDRDSITRQLGNVARVYNEIRVTMFVTSSKVS